MTRTAMVTTATLIALGLYDLAAAVWGGEDATISRFLQGQAFEQPVVVFAFGFVAGHIFGYMKPRQWGGHQDVR